MYKSTDNYFQEEPPKFEGSIHWWIQWHSIVSLAAMCFFVFIPKTFNSTAFLPLSFFCACSFLQATLLLICMVLYSCGRREYVGLLVLSLALAWINVLYYSRGSKQMGIYSVMMQRVRIKFQWSNVSQSGIFYKVCFSFFRWSCMTYYTFYVCMVSFFLDFQLVRLLWTPNAKTKMLSRNQKDSGSNLKFLSYL